jgi:hypothetical protein
MNAMASQHAAVRVERPRPHEDSARPHRSPSVLIAGAPTVALAAGIAAQWLDFRALREPILLFVGLGVLATAIALARGRGGWRAFAIALATGIATWAAAETLYVILHVALGERFDAPRFGAQWSQALGLIGVHALFLGAPTGAVAGLLLQIPAVRRLGAREDA